MAYALVARSLISENGSVRKIHDSHPGCRHKVLTSNLREPCGICLYLLNGFALGLRWGRFIANYLQMNVAADFGASEGKRGQFRKRKLQDPGDSELLSNLLGRLEIQGGARMTLQLCLQRVVTPAGVGKYDAASQGCFNKAEAPV